MNTENNKIIADFMGFEKFKSQLDYIIFDIPQHKRDVVTEQNGGTLFSEMDLKFHSDWNWLMEVVEKIRMFHNSTTLLNDNQISQLIILIKKLNESLTLRNNVSIEAVYNACIYFINWYNEQKN